MSDDSNDDLQLAYAFNSAWADRIALLILVGLGIDIIAVFLLEKHALEASLAIAANGLIALGVWGELWFAKRAKQASDGIVAQANARAAEANQKAQEATLELVKFRQPRGLTPEARGRVVQKIWRLGPLKFEASVNPGDPEFIHCLRNIELALQEAGWIQLPWKGSGSGIMRPGLPNIGSESSVRNVAIFFRLEDSSNRYQRPAIALAEALIAEGIAADARVTLPEPNELSELPPFHIAVGPKT